MGDLITANQIALWRSFFLSQSSFQKCLKHLWEDAKSNTLTWEKGCVIHTPCSLWVMIHDDKLMYWCLGFITTQVIHLSKRISFHIEWLQHCFNLYVRIRKTRCLLVVHQTCWQFIRPHGLAQGGTNTSTGEEDEGYRVACNLSS